MWHRVAIESSTIAQKSSMVLRYLQVFVQVKAFSHPFITLKIINSCQDSLQLHLHTVVQVIHHPYDRKVEVMFSPYAQRQTIFT